jgi:hypothetical protein
MKIVLLSVLIYSFGFSISSAHVGINYPVGDEEFKSDSMITIQWYIAIDHGDCSWSIYFSYDNGYSWSRVAENLSKSQLEYDWIIPQIETSSGRIKIIQDNYIGINYETESGQFYDITHSNRNSIRSD